MEGWQDVQRQGQDLADRFSFIAQGIGSMLQTQIRIPGVLFILPETLELSSSQLREAAKSLKGGILSSSSWPWLLLHSQTVIGKKNRASGSRKTAHVRGLASRKESWEGLSGIQELGKRLGQAGAELGTCMGELVGNLTRQLWKPPNGGAAAAFTAQATTSSSSSFPSSPQDQILPRSRSIGKPENGIPANVPYLESSSSPSEEFSSGLLTKPNDSLHKQSSVSVITTYDSITQDIESSVVARGDLWRAEASHGSTSSGSRSPLFMLQIGPVLLVKDSTLLLPVHLSKQHLLWYGFDRKSGLHSLCPAIWSKQRKWLLMSMISLNSLRCTFMDLQFPNGQLTYIAGEGFTTKAFVPAVGGVLQAQSRLPGETRLSYSYKNKFATRITPSVLFPEKSFSFGVVQPLSWQRSGLMLRPTVQLSVTPTFGGQNAGWRAEVVHLLSEKLSWGCGLLHTLEPHAFAFICVGRSKQNVEYNGNSGLVLQVEAPWENPGRASMCVQLNSRLEF